MIDRLAKFNELVPSSLPFVEGRLEGHKERKIIQLLDVELLKTPNN